MPILKDFEYHKPAALKDALALAAKYKCGARALAGGTDLIVRLKEGLDAPDAVIDLKKIKELSRLEIKAGALRVGACVTFSGLIASKTVRDKFPALWEAAKTVACVGIRNRATLAGNICSAVPSADSAPALLIYGAAVHLDGPKGKRAVPAEKWFLGPRKTALCDGELVTAVSIPLPKKHGGCYVKLGRYAGEDLAQAGVALSVDAADNYRVAFCAVCPAPKRAPRIEKFLSGKKLSPEVLAEAKNLVALEICAITDIRASKEYRLRMSKVMLERGLKAAASRLAGKGPALGEKLV